MGSIRVDLVSRPSSLTRLALEFLALDACSRPPAVQEWQEGRH